MFFDNANNVKRIVATTAVCAGGIGVGIGCGGDDSASAGSSDSSVSTTSSSSAALPQGSEPANLDPADFTTNIDNPYFPMKPGNKWVYEETDTTGVREDVVVEVTDKTKMIANGVEARVVRDTVSEDGVPVEITDDWYAQDSVGNIWYLGEYVSNYKNGKVVDHTGSFEAGVDGAEAGVALPANPEPGMEYRQEYYAGEAEDEGAVITVGEESVEVPFGFFDKDVLMTRDLVPTEPKVQELKFYAPGVGPLLSVHTDGDGGRGELVSFTQGS
ncbi:MAG: hypothetical protein ACR2G3_02655 [Solirubrobacterales bacterium]